MLKTQLRSLIKMGGLVILSAVVTASFMVASRSFGRESNEAKLNQLMHERIDILQQIVAQIEELHRQRLSGLKDLYAARVALFRAKLEICTSDEQRIDMLEQLLEAAKQRELTERNSLKASAREVRKTNHYEIEKTGAWLPVAEAQVDRLNIEIELERLRSK